MEITRKKLIIIYLPVILGCIIIYFLATASPAGSQAAGTEQKAQAIPVSVGKVMLKSVARYEELPGRTSAFRIAEIRPQVNGIVTKRLFTEGELVEKGDQLYQIDAAPYRAAYNSAIADLQKTKANVKSVQARADRYKELVEIEAVSRQEYDDNVAALGQAKADISVANAAVAAAKVNLDYTKVYAPISGRSSKSFVTEGALVTANQAGLLARVTQLDPIYVDLTQSSAEMLELRDKIKNGKDLPVKLYYENSDNLYSHVGKLEFSDVTVDETTGSVQIRSIFPNPEEELLPGLFVTARIELPAEEKLTIPKRAVIRNADGSLTAWVVNSESIANPVPISIGKESDNEWVVESGVKEGDVVITAGFQKIRPGTLVTYESEKVKEKEPKQEATKDK